MVKNRRQPARRVLDLASALLVQFIFLPIIALAQDEPQLVQHRFASAPDINAPTGISVSPEGVAFVSCDTNGVTNRKRKVGRVVRCEDTDGDGKADKFTDFVSGVDSPRGSCFVGNSLYLMQPPLLVAWQDRDGDGVAESSEKLVEGLGQGLRTGGVVHGANGICMGIDGWLYLAIGDQGCLGATGTDGSKANLYGGGLLRVRPDGSQLSVFATGTRNLYDVAVDPFLNLFSKDNSNDGGGWGTRLLHLTEFADYGYPSRFKNFGHEVAPALADFGAGTSTGVHFLHEPGFPDEIGNALYSGNLDSGIYRHPLKAFDGSFQVQRCSFMDAPANIGIDVDGFSRVYCVSRAGGGFGFASEPFGHVDIIQPTDRSRAARFPSIENAKDAELVDHLASESQVARLNAMREIVARGSKFSASNSLRKLALNPERPLYSRVAAIMTLKQLEGARAHPFFRELYQDGIVREFVVRALSDVRAEIDDGAKSIIREALTDADPRVQMRAIAGLVRADDQESAKAILSLAGNQKLIALSEPDADKAEQDGWATPHRIVSPAAIRAVILLAPVGMLLEILDDEELREPALRCLQEIHSKEVVEGLSKKVSATNDQQLAKLITVVLFRLYHREAEWDGKSWWRSRPNFAGPYFRCTKWKHTPTVREAIRIAFRKADPSDYPELFHLMRLNQVPELELKLDIEFDEALALLDKQELTSSEFNLLMDAAVDPKRPEREQLLAYDYFRRGSLPESYLNRVQILRRWGEAKAKGELQREAYKEFVSGNEFVGRIKELSKFLGEDENDCNKFAHIQLIHLINNPDASEATRKAATEELEKTWDEAKKIYPHRLRGLMLAFEEIDPTPYAENLRPLVDHRDERTKQGAARFLKLIDAKRE